MIEIRGTLKAVTFKAKKGEQPDPVATISIECHPNELESGRLARLAGKTVDVTISSRQIALPIKD